MKEDNVGAVVVAHGGKKVVGVLTDRDIALKLGLGEAEPGTPVEHVMTKHVVTIREHGTIIHATQYFMEHQIRRLRIVDDEGELVGMITLDDALAHLAKESRNLGQAIAPAIAEKSCDCEFLRIPARFKTGSFSQSLRADGARGGL
jgi:signal-transduction protein with cAMP-binding, CBS, and nucleotidyltransferase domain